MLKFWSSSRHAPLEPTLEQQRLEFVAGAAGSLGWDCCVHDEQRRSFSSIRRSQFRGEDTAAWFRIVEDGTPWSRPQLYGGGLLPRRAAWFVKSGCKCGYGYGGTHWPPVEMPDWLLDIEFVVWGVLGGARVPAPNCCVANFYADGTHSVDWHADDEPLFEGTSRDCCIVSLSLGGSRRFDLRQRRGTKRQVVSVDPMTSLFWTDNTQKELHDGDIITMEGLFQKHWYHRVPRQKGCDQPRINLTWRTITAHSPALGCPLALKEAVCSENSATLDVTSLNRPK